MKFAGLVWSNLKRRKLRTALTILSVLIAFLLFGFLGAIKQALVGGVDLTDANRLIVRHRVSIIQSLPLSYMARIGRIPGVVSVTPFVWFNGIYQDPKNFFGSFPVDPVGLLDMYPEISLPAAQRQAWLETRTGAVIGRGLADRFGWKIGDRIPLVSPIWPKAGASETWEFDVVGIYDAGKTGADTSGFYFRYDYFDEARQQGKGSIGWYTVRVDSAERAAAISKAIDNDFANSPAETKAETEGAFAQGFVQQFGDIAAIVTAILAAVFFTILLVAGNTMAQSVRERTNELGVLKAIGFSNERVLGIVIAESFTIAALGGVLGLGFALLIVAAAAPALATYLPGFFLPAKDLFAGVGLILVLGLVAGILPALTAMRLRIAEALRRSA
jgi:putative ABC transport system permease protein